MAADHLNKTEAKPKAVNPRSLANLTGKGRPKGVPNKITSDLKAMILGALSNAHPEGGEAYLIQQANANPVAFLSLVGKVLPLTVSAAPETGFVVRWQSE